MRDQTEAQVALLDAPLSDVQRALLDAAAIVRKRWQQSGYGEIGEARCLIGAVTEAQGMTAPDGREPSPVTYRCALLIERVIETSEIARWNDTPGRTSEQVATALEAAASMDATP